MSLERIDKHFGAGLVNLIPPFWGKPVIAAILRSYLNRVQQLEDDAWRQLTAFDVNTCDAVRLAVLGRVVCLRNRGWDTETYRRVIRGKIAANKSRGLDVDIQIVTQLALPTELDVVVWSFAPATMLVAPQEPVTPEGQEALMFLLPKTRAAGVQMHVAFSPDTATEDYDYTSGGRIYGDVVDPVTTPGAPWFDVRRL